MIDQLTNFLGHDIRVHREFYRLPEGCTQVTRISKLLMAAENGVNQFQWKCLDKLEPGVSAQRDPLDVLQETGRPVDVLQETGGPVHVPQETGRPVDVLQETGGPVDVLQDMGRPVDVLHETGRPADVLQDTGRPVEVLQGTGGPLDDAGQTDRACPDPSELEEMALDAPPSKRLKRTKWSLDEKTAVWRVCGEYIRRGEVPEISM